MWPDTGVEPSERGLLITPVLVLTVSRHVLVPFTDSEEATQALEHALTSFSEATITVLHVGSVNAADEADAHLEAAEVVAAKHDTTVETALLRGTPKHEIIQYAEEHDIDHIVMGSRGRSGMSRLLLGSVAETVVRRSPVPVTVVR